MGCCVSTERPASTSYPSNPSSRHINAPESQSQSALPRPSTGVSDQSSQARQLPRFPVPSQRSNRPAKKQSRTQRPTKPLVLHVWQSDSRTWTRAQLDRERTEFFETRSEGRPEVWLTLRSALEVLWSGGDAQDNDGGLATAQTILEAAEVTLPYGDLAKGAYDAYGAFYELPEPVVSDPANIVEGSVGEIDDGQTEVGDRDVDDKDVGDKAEEDDKEANEQAALRRREAKGKGVVVKVRTRIVENGNETNCVIEHGRDDHVRLLIQKICEDAKIDSSKTIKISYMGRILQRNQSLAAQGWNEEFMITAMVFSR